MNTLTFLTTAVSGPPAGGLPTSNLPEAWMRLTVFVVCWFVLPAVFAIHAWIWRHQRLYHTPPYLILRLSHWWRGGKVGQRFPGWGKRHGKA